MLHVDSSATKTVKLKVGNELVCMSDHHKDLYGELHDNYKKD